MNKIVVGITVMIISIILAAASVMYKKQTAAECDYDGTGIVPVYEVNILLKDGDTKRFCSIKCAEAWYRINRHYTDSVTVTDEITGSKIDAGLAVYVKSNVVTVTSNRNGIHVFRKRPDAMAHADRHDGKLVRNPFQ